MFVRDEEQPRPYCAHTGCRELINLMRGSPTSCVGLPGRRFAFADCKHCFPTAEPWDPRSGHEGGRPLERGWEAMACFASFFFFFLFLSCKSQVQAACMHARRREKNGERNTCRGKGEREKIFDCMKSDAFEAWVLGASSIKWCLSIHIRVVCI